MLVRTDVLVLCCFLSKGEKSTCPNFRHVHSDILRSFTANYKSLWVVQRTIGDEICRGAVSSWAVAVSFPGGAQRDGDGGMCAQAREQTLCPAQCGTSIKASPWAAALQSCALTPLLAPNHLISISLASWMFYVTPTVELEHKILLLGNTTVLIRAIIPF